MTGIVTDSKKREYWKLLGSEQKKLWLALSIAASVMGCTACTVDKGKSNLKVDKEYDKTKDLMHTISKKYNCNIDDIEIINPKSGDNLTKIANRYGMTLEEICEINGIKNPNLITLEMDLIVINRTKSKNNSESEMGILSNADIAKMYNCDISDIEELIIEPNDNLSSIAFKYGMTLKEICHINGISNPDLINVGDKLIIINRAKKLSNEEKYESTTTDYKYDTSIFSKSIKENGYAKGIDISQVGQSNINLSKVLQLNPIDFVMVRMGYFIGPSRCDQNNDGIDDKFRNYAQVCANNNVPMGIYFWPSLENVQKAKIEVEKVVKELEYLKNEYNLCLQMPICLDIELSKDGGGNIVNNINNGDNNTIAALEYTVRTLEEKGYYVMIYTGNNCLKENPIYKSVISELGVDTWVPKYRTNSKIDFSTLPPKSIITENVGRTSINQYSQNGWLKGYDGPVDLDICYIDFPELIKKHGLNGFEDKQRSL